MHALPGKSTSTSGLTGFHLHENTKIRIKNLPFRKFQKPVIGNYRAPHQCSAMVTDIMTTSTYVHLRPRDFVHTLLDTPQCYSSHACNFRASYSKHIHHSIKPGKVIGHLHNSFIPTTITKQHARLCKLNGYM